MTNDPYEDDWRVYRRLVLKELETLHQENRELRAMVDAMRDIVTELKVRVALIAAGIAAAASIVVSWVANNITLG